MAKVSVALSGGGHRASLFGLGVLLYLADAGKNTEVESISSVSGGSLTNGYVGQVGNYRQMDGKGFWREARPFARQVALYGTLWACWSTWLYLLGLLGSLVVVCGVLWLPYHWAVRWGLFLVALLAWAKLALEQRGRVCSRALKKTLFSRNGKATFLSGIAHADLDHVICATDLQAGEHVYFSGRFICSYRFGFGTPADLTLAQAVQCSAAYPTGFPASWLRTSRHQFRNGTTEAKNMVLLDGGVYDNMAEQWAFGLNARRRRWPAARDQLHDADELIAVNACAGMGFESVRRLRLPLIGELLTLFRVINVLYDNTTSPRRQMLFRQFSSAAKSGDGLRGTLVTLEQSPFDIPDYFIKHADEWPEWTDRATAVIKMLSEGTRNEWVGIVAHNKSVSTTLKALGKEASVSLLRHAYVAAMANLHVILGYPLLDVPSEDRFTDLLK
jgi:predicted acylesterase/phospholipase RssA